MNLVLGIDTSAYTTSLALISQTGELIGDVRQVLEVEEGKRGLRQSEALFLHIKNIPSLFAELEDRLRQYSLGAIAVSTCPRNVTGSYMPVFLAGEGAARILSSVKGIPLFTFSHQEGHIAAGLFASDRELPERCLAVHFSGGTSEVLLVEPGHVNYYTIEVLAATTDLHAGQLVDRVGVKMGLPFPAGRYLEEKARAFTPKGKKKINIPAAVNGDRFSFSGAETRALRLIEAGAAEEEVAFAVLRCISNTLVKTIRKQAEALDIREVLLVGGVMANSLIRQRLEQKLTHPAVGLKLHFASPGLSTDNAVGIAELGRKSWLETR
ncbi:MAG: peptidase M22 [Syntrophothermaceae bacterium]|jgi:N6-L-threonylcarbamoyladenine synthase